MMIKGNLYRWYFTSRFGLKMPTHAPKIGGLGIWPKMVRSINNTQKAHCSLFVLHLSHHTRKWISGP